MKALITRWVFDGESRARHINVGLLRGLKFVLDPQHRWQRFLGLNEKEIAPHVRQATEHGRTAIDVGAHDGWYTTFFASRPNIAKVLACDPNRAVVDRLISNVTLNNLAHKVAVHRVAVGASKAVGFRSLDDLLLHEAPPFVIKIDVDGGELDVLSSGRTVLSEHVCSVIVETHSLDLERECTRYMQQLGYETTVIPNAWYRTFIPELRPIAHNRWFIAARSRR